MSDGNGRQPVDSDQLAAIPPPPDAVFDCELGRIAERSARHTEIDPAALMLCLTSTIGAAIGPSPHVWFGETRHPAVVWVCLVGASGAARKSTTIKRAIRLAVDADPTLDTRVISGLGSGEALVDDLQTDQQGRHDPRRIIREHELSRVLRVCRREGSTLSAMLRDAWDGHRLETRSRTSGTRTVTEHHLALLAAITPTEMRTGLDEALLKGGFANRVLWVPLRAATPRMQLRPDLPEPGRSPIRPIIDSARKRAEVAFDGIALRHLDERYQAHHHYLASLGDTPVAAIHARHWPHVIRVALVICLCDQEPLVTERHLVIAEALVTWCEHTPKVVLGGARIGDPIADRIVAALRAHGELPRGVIRREIFGGHIREDALERAIIVAELAGQLVRVTAPAGPKGGRPATILRAV